MVVDKLSDAETTNEHRYAAVRTPLYRLASLLKNKGKHNDTERPHVAKACHPLWPHSPRVLFTNKFKVVILLSQFCIAGL